MADEVMEFAKSYEYCFFKVPIKAQGEHRSFFLTHIDPKTQTVHGRLITRTFSEKAQTYKYEEFRQVAEPIIPVAGYIWCFLDRPTAVFLSLDPSRQYRKALYFEHSGIKIVPTGSPESLKFLAAIKAGDCGSLIKVVANSLAARTPQYLPIRGAVDLVESGEMHSCPISRFFAVSLAKNFNVPVLWHKNSKEGVFVGKQLFVTNKLLPFKEFFLKRWDMNILPISQAPRV